MENALIVSGTDNGIAFFTTLLGKASIRNITALKSASEAGRLMLERSFDLVLINAPLVDETGETLARRIALRGVCPVILVVKSELFEAVSGVCEDDGVMTIAKPLNETVFWAALKLAKSTQNRIRKMQDENEKMKRQIEDIRIVDRAKYILISTTGMSEKEAHRHIEKQAMDTRTTKRAVAEEILKIYEN